MVKPERQRKKSDGQFALRKPLPERWWHYADKRPALYATIAGMDRVLVKSEVGNKLSFALVPNTAVFSHMLIVFALDDHGSQAILQSSLHEIWAREFASSMRTDLRYTPSDCFETFPLADSTSGLLDIGQHYHDDRQSVMLVRGEGLTKIYNRFHNRAETAVDIRSLREIHVEMDCAVVAAYGWTDLDLGHAFHSTKQGVRFTISEPARQEVVGRLLRLNHERYADEVRRGLHDRKKTRAGSGDTAEIEDMFEES
jgi:hypothetical protein